MNTTSSEILRHALYYAETNGWHVFPSPPGTKKSHKSAEYSDGRPWGATRDLDEIRRDFEQWPDTNVGIVCGEISGIFVVEADTLAGHGKDGFAALAGLEAKHGPLPATLQAESPSGSVHFYFRYPGFHVKTSASEIAPGIDVRGDGGMVIAPPSVKPGSGAYKWRSILAIANAPDWLLDMVKTPEGSAMAVGIAREAPAGLRPLDDTHAARILKAACEKVLAAESGMRNAALNAQAFFVGQYVGSGEIGRDVAIYDLLTACDESGLLNDDGEPQCKATILSGLDKGAKKPAPPMFDGVALAALPATASPSLAPGMPTDPLPDLIKTSAEFVRDFVPPEYLLDGVLQKRFCYSFTAQTGVGKTTVAMLISAHVADGRSLGTLDVAKGTVLYFAGENPTDIQMRWLGLTQEMKMDPATADVHFIPGAVPLSTVAARITAEVVAKGLQPALVVVDTAAAYFEGDDENSNTQAVEHARRMRSLTDLPGGPCVLILCHPTKRATEDDLIPRGGGAFLAEVDGNIALQKRESLVVASVQGKFRGREFSPLSFELKTVHHPVLKDARGRDIPTVIARPIDEADKQQMAATSRRHEDMLLKAIFEHPGASLRALAAALKWVDGKQQPNAMKVSRAADVLAREKLIQKHRGSWQCTSAGEKELNKLDRPANVTYPLTPTVTPPVTAMPAFPSIRRL